MQNNKKYLFNRIGTVSDMIGLDKAEIEFQLNNKIEKALLWKNKFFYYGKHVSESKHLTDYIIVGSKVVFSCHVLNSQENNDGQTVWYIVICQNYEEKVNKQLNLKTGLVNISGCIRDIQKRHGVLYTDHNSEMVYFLASKYYIDGKRLSSSRSLNEVLQVNDIVFFDAIPCIPEENEFLCNWFAILVFRGKRPDEKPKPQKSYIYDCIGRCTNEARTVFFFGTGTIINIFNEDLGLILGQFRVNQFQTVLFHRKNAFLFKICLANVDLNQIFVEGDSVNFIAVGAPEGFVTDWVAIQVSVFTNSEKDKKFLCYQRKLALENGNNKQFASYK